MKECTRRVRRPVPKSSFLMCTAQCMQPHSIRLAMGLATDPLEPGQRPFTTEGVHGTRRVWSSTACFLLKFVSLFCSGPVIKVVGGSMIENRGGESSNTKSSTSAWFAALLLACFKRLSNAF